MNLDNNIKLQIAKIADCYSYIEKIILFGSRARKDNWPKSDIDLAVYSSEHLFEFIYDLETKTDTLLEFDVTCMNSSLDEEFIEQIEVEGKCIYEKH